MAANDAPAIACIHPYIIEISIKLIKALIIRKSHADHEDQQQKDAE